MSRPADENAAAPGGEPAVAPEDRPTLDELLEQLDDAADHPFAQTLARFEEEDRHDQQMGELPSGLEGLSVPTTVGLILAIATAVALLILWAFARPVR